MIYSGELFGKPVYTLELGESIYGDKNLPAVRYDRDKANDLIGDGIVRELHVIGINQSVSHAFKKYKRPRDGK